MPSNCGFIWFVNCAYGYLEYLEKGLEKTSMIDVFGKMKELNGTLKFPIITTRDDVFLKQCDTWNSGVVIMAYVLEFYVHQFNSPYLIVNDQYKIKKKGDHWTYEINSDVYKMGQLWSKTRILFVRRCSKVNQQVSKG